MKTIGTLFILCLFFPLANAEALYVTDILYVSMRDTPFEGSTSIKVLKTGTKLEKLEENDEGLIKVRTESGLEGWIKKRYLVEEPVARLKLESQQQVINRLDKENGELKRKLANSKKKTNESDKERKRMQSKSQKLELENQKLKKIAAKPLELSKENEGLKNNNEQMKQELTTLRKENESYKSKSGRDWFIAGAGVLLFGLVIGVIIPSIRWRKRNTWA